MSNTQTNLHRIVHIGVEDSQPSPAVPGSRWQNIIFTASDGSQHIITAYLVEGYPGFEAFQRPPANPHELRRAEDLPRQTTLKIEEPRKPWPFGE